MTKIKSGVTLMAVGIGLNLSGRFWLMLHPPLPSLLAVAASQALFMIASVVLVLFGLFRVIAGLLTRKKQTGALPVVMADDTVWPPAPKSPVLTQAGSETENGPEAHGV